MGCYLMIDIAKAYDTVDRNFLEKTLIPLGFHENMVKWIMVCVTIAKFTVCLNGERRGYFPSRRGLRQGDPISPYLLTIVMEIFTRMMKKNTQQNGDFKYHKGCKEIQLTHLCLQTQPTHCVKKNTHTHTKCYTQSYQCT